MTRTWIILLILFFGTVQSHGQGENNVWAFGYGNGFDFNGGGLSFFTSSSMGVEGSATVSDAAGHLLFYCDGTTIFDRTHTAMPNGSGILGNSSSTQGVAIAPVHGVDSQYYVFTLTAFGSEGYLRYTIVNMKLNSGFGDVDILRKNVKIDSAMSEKMAIAGGCDDNWLLVHHQDSAKFYAYKLASGITTPVVSYVGSFGLCTYAIGEMKVSPDNSKIALANYYSIRYSTVDLFDFDLLTGMVSNHQLIDSYVTPLLYSVEFSPDGSKLYTNAPGVYQFDLMAGSLSAIRGSKYLVDANIPWGMRRGPDGMIYMGGTVNYSRIKKPNLPRISCDFEANFGPPGLRVGLYLTFGNHYPTGITTSSHTYSRKICRGRSVSMDRSAFDENTWFDDSTNAIRVFSDTGTYWVRSKKGCNVVIDTFVLTEEIPLRLSSIKRDTLCPGLTIKLDGRAGADSFRWHDGSLAASRTIAATPGVYWVVSNTGCTTATDSFLIYRKIDRIYQEAHKVRVCGKDSALLSGKDGVEDYTWSTGHTGKKIKVKSDSKVWVSSNKGCDQYVDTFLVENVPFLRDGIRKDTSICWSGSALIAAPPLYHQYQWSAGNTTKDTVLYKDAMITVTATDTLNCKILSTNFNVRFVNDVTGIGDTFLCNEGDSVILDATVPLRPATYEWSTGEKTPQITVSAAGTRFVIVNIYGCQAIDSAVVKNFGFDLNIGGNQRVCSGEKLTLKANVDGASYQWSTGASSPEIEISESGFYTLSIIKDGCRVTDAADIRFVQCSNCIAVPNAFTPNNDGINDRFKPVFNCPVLKYEFSIHNRWGNILFTSTSPNDSWDGTVNGSLPDGNVYYYMIKVKFDIGDDKEQLYKGDVTLIR